MRRAAKWQNRQTSESDAHRHANAKGYEEFHGEPPIFGEQLTG
jgi:hypothetical protein